MRLDTRARGGLLLLLLLLEPGSGFPQSESELEYNIKAVFLYNFTRYLKWPDNGGQGRFEIDIIGDSAIEPALREIAAKKTVNQREIVVRTVTDPAAIGRPHILFVSRSADVSLLQIVEKTRGAGSLVVSEQEGAASRGAAVNFVLRNGAVRFEVNEKAMREAGIEPSCQLLKLAILVNATQDAKK